MGICPICDAGDPTSVIAECDCATRGGRDGLVWLVETYNDLGTQELHRWHVTGRIYDEGDYLGFFNWRVPNLSDPAYVFPDGRPPTERLT